MEELCTTIRNTWREKIKMDIFIITPHSLDSLLVKKRQVVEYVSKKYGINVNYGPNPPYDEINREEIVNLYEHVDYFIADLSYERPSCYFEVGFVQGLNKPIHLIAMDGTDIHQVFGRDKVRFYKNIDEYENLINSLLSIRTV
jgi:hypothetical protein